MSYYGNGVIAITGKGCAETEFTSATYKVNVTTLGKTGPQAKEKALPIIEAIRKTILANADKAAIDTTRLKTTFSVDIETSRNTGEFVGYRASYSATFTGKNVVAALAMHDALTSIEGVQAPTPIYNVDDSLEIQNRAFKDAVEKAKSKFEGQCFGLGLRPNDFDVQSWSIQEEQPRGKTLSFNSDAGRPQAVGLEPGKATLDLTVTLVYVAKKPTP